MGNTHKSFNQFSAGLNTLQNPVSLPFEHPNQNGWKVYCDNLTIGATYATDAYWTATTNGGGTLGPGAANSMVMTGDGSADSGYSLYKLAADKILNKKFYMETKVMLTATSVPDNAIFVGYTSANEAMTTTAVDALDGGDEAIGFGMVSQDTAMSFYSRQDGTQQTISLGKPLVTAVWTKFACYYDGGNFNLYRDDRLVSKTVMTKLNTDEGMTPQVFFEAVNAAANTLNVQYLLLAVEL